MFLRKRTWFSLKDMSQYDPEMANEAHCLSLFCEKSTDILARKNLLEYQILFNSFDNKFLKKIEEDLL